MADPSLADIFSITKDASLTGLLIWVVRSFMAQTLVSGLTYHDQVARAEKAEAVASSLAAISDRATRTAEELLHVVKGRPA